MSDDLNRYAQATNGEWAGYLATLPTRMHGGLIRYILDGKVPGDFLVALLTNDLMLTLKKADDENRNLLWQYGSFLYNGAPADCFGSAERFDAWVAKGGLEGMQS